jgi:hypothetical protein
MKRYRNILMLKQKQYFIQHDYILFTTMDAKSLS